jgi:hypothetical protein
LSPERRAKYDIKQIFENVSQIKYLKKDDTNQNLIQQKVKRRLVLGNA